MPDNRGKLRPCYSGLLLPFPMGLSYRAGRPGLSDQGFRGGV